MEAKKIYETIADILLPKSKEDLEVSMTQHMGEYKDIIDECYEFIQYHPEHFEINEELGLHYDGYSNWYGFSFLNLFEKNLDEAEYSIEFENLDEKSVIMNQRNGETYKQIKSLDSLVFYFNAYEPIAESVTDVLKPKTDIEMKSLLPSEAEELVDDCYSMVSMNPNYEIEYELGFYQGIYGFYFNTKEPLKTGDEHHLGEIGEYSFGYFVDMQAVYLFFENNGWGNEITNIEDLQQFLIGDDNDYDPKRMIGLSEDLSAVFKPKPEQLVATEYAKQYPVFAKIFYSMFPNETFDVEANADSNRVSARFGFTSGEHKFLVTQDEYHVYPQISYLKKTENTSGFGGIFTHHRDVRTHDDIINYVKQMSGEKY